MAHELRSRLAGRLLSCELRRSLLGSLPLRPRTLPFVRSGGCSSPLKWQTFPSQRRHSNCTPQKNSTNLSPERIILDYLQHIKHDKWGFVIYRCTYNDDEGWNHFKQLIRQQTQESLQRSDTPEVFDSLEWTFVEDRLALDGATRPWLREHFNQWAGQAIVTEQPRAQTENHQAHIGISRYSYFIQVDEEALQSVLAVPERDSRREDFVNLVDSRWTSLSEKGYHYPGHPEDEEVFDPIDGCTEEDVGWMRIARDSIGSNLYMMDDYSWYAYYLRPPAVVLD